MNDPRGLPMDAMDKSGGPGFSIGRRRLLTYAVASPVMTIAAGLGVNLATPSSAVAAPMSLMEFSTPTMPLVKLSVGTDGKVTLEMPRLENDRGIATALGMMIAEEMDVPLSDVIVNSADAQPELRCNQITGGSSSIRCFDPVLPVMAAAARARLVGHAAQQWGLAPSSLRVEAGVVIAPDGRSATYGSLMIAFAVSSVTISSTKRGGWICTERYETVFQSKVTGLS
jgi:isoquinoline 1-oxidoreductase beta subunit